MYEKHIEDLKFKSDASACCPEALAAAVELMRAAEPKDVAAEREHCQKAGIEAVVAIAFTESHRNGGDVVGEHIERERAHARAAGYAAGRESLKAESDTDHELLVGVAHALETKLAAAQAEVEHRNTLCRSLREERDAAQTKLSNLRAAAERARQCNYTGDQCTALLNRAIEESR